jgi:hypothetical protein
VKTKEEELQEFDWLSLLPEPPTPEQRAEWEALQARERDRRAAEHNRRATQLLAEDRWKQRQRELPAERRQAAIDAVWQRTLEERELEQEEDTSFHRGPGDPDYRR